MLAIYRRAPSRSYSLSQARPTSVSWETNSYSQQPGTGNPPRAIWWLQSQARSHCSFNLYVGNFRKFKFYVNHDSQPRHLAAPFTSTCSRSVISQNSNFPRQKLPHAILRLKFQSARPTSVTSHNSNFSPKSPRAILRLLSQVRVRF